MEHNPQWTATTDPRVKANGHKRAHRGEHAGATPEPTTYYNRPMIKKPTWRWYIPLYFFLGGLASGVSFIGALAEFFGGREHRSTVRHARYLSVVLAAICPIPLIVDLGRPTRFHHMFRVFKVSSPLSVGTWILTGFGLLSGAQAARQAAEDDFVLRRESALGRLARALPSGPVTALHGLFGMGLGGYTGVLLAANAVPLWQAGGKLLGPLFLAASATSGAATLNLTGVATGTQTRRTREEIQMVANVGTVTQIGLAVAHEMLVPRKINEPLRQGVWGRLFRGGTIGLGLLAPIGVRFLAWASGRNLEPAVSTVAATLTLTGTLIERFALVEAGKISAEDPLAYQELSRGSPGEARPTPEQQAKMAPRHAWEHPFQRGQVVPETAHETPAYRAGMRSDTASS